MPSSASTCWWPPERGSRRDGTGRARGKHRRRCSRRGTGHSGDQYPLGGRPGTAVFRRRRAAGSAGSAGHPGLARAGPGRGAAVRRADRGVGGAGRAPADPHVFAAGRRLPAVPEHARARLRDSGRGLSTWPCSRTGFPRSVRTCWRCRNTPSWGRAYPAGGRCEVVSFTSAHTGSFAGLESRRVRDRDRRLGAPHRGTERAARDRRRCSASRTAAQEIGVTLHHPHGQIYAYSYVPPRGRRDGGGRARHFDERRTGGRHADRGDSGRGTCRRRADGARGRALQRLRAVRRALAAGGPSGSRTARCRTWPG